MELPFLLGQEPEPHGAACCSQTGRSWSGRGESHPRLGRAPGSAVVLSCPVAGLQGFENPRAGRDFDITLQRGTASPTRPHGDRRARTRRGSHRDPHSPVRRATRGVGMECPTFPQPPHPPSPLLPPWARILGLGRDVVSLSDFWGRCPRELRGEVHPVLPQLQRGK